MPFDDRVNRKAKIDDIRRGYLEDFIRKSNSSLVMELNSSSIEELLLAQEVANETDTELDIRNKCCSGQKRNTGSLRMK